MAEIIIHNMEEFDNEVIKSKIPVLVDFWAVWCGPCKMVAPHISKIAEDNEGKIKVCKVDVDENSDIAQEYGISSIPTILFFKNGNVVSQHIGAAPYSTIQALINN